MIESTMRFRRPGVFARLARGGLLALAAAMPGCADGGPLTGPDLAPPPTRVMTPDSAELATGRLQAWAAESNVVDPERVGALGVISRPVRARLGYGRILCRLILHGPKHEPVRVDGPIEAVLIARPNLPDAEVLGIWSLSTAEAAESFRYGRMPGYQLDLAWGRQTRASMYRLVFRWTSDDGKLRQRSVITFEDTFSHGYEAPAPTR